MYLSGRIEKTTGLVPHSLSLFKNRLSQEVIQMTKLWRFSLYYYLCWVLVDSVSCACALHE